MTVNILIIRCLLGVANAGIFVVSGKSDSSLHAVKNCVNGRRYFQNLDIMSQKQHSSA